MTVFDSTFRNQYATAPVGEILTGTITHETIHSSIQIALTATAEAMYTAAALTLAAHQLSSPLLSQVIRLMQQTPQSSTATTAHLTRKPRDDATESNTRSPIASSQPTEQFTSTTGEA